MTVPGQTAINYTYDNANRLIQITQGSSIVSFTYDAAGRRASLTLPNGILIEYVYDAASRVTGITYKKGATVLGDLTYAYDKTGNRTKVGGTFARTGIPQAMASATFDAANRQTNHTYDNNGNLVSDGTNTYTWNARNQLTAISSGVTASFVYDGFGRREKKTINGNLTEFLYDRVNAVQETSGANVLANILTGPRTDEYFTRADSTGTQNLLPDALGSIIALADSSGIVQTEYTYEPFGRTTVTGSANSNSTQFTGRENDGTGLYYYRARYYYPGLHRFISEDPKYSPYHGSYDPATSYNPSVSNYMERDPNVPLFGMRGACPSMYLDSRLLHLYGYANGNPTNLIDPEGLTAGPQSPGCDYIEPETKCMTACCDEHDRCFKRAMEFCDMSSWLEKFPRRFGCLRCNVRVAKCIICCWTGIGKRKDEC
jgi:RHS repeat-associated protein